MMPTSISNGRPISGDMLVVIDESSPDNQAGGVAYVVTAAAMLAVPEVVTGLTEMLPASRKRPFHWAKEGPAARKAIIDVIISTGVVAVAHCAYVSRRGQLPVRLEMLADLSSWAAIEGATHLMIEASDDATIGRDRKALLDRHRELGGVPFAYDWRSKSEPVLWVADAIAGSVGEFVVNKNAHWFEQLRDAGAVNLRFR
jgi:hypothetical protein